MASAGKLNELAASSCDRLRKLYGKRVDDQIEMKSKGKLKQIRADADGNQHTTD